MVAVDGGLAGMGWDGRFMYKLDYFVWRTVI